MISSWDRFITEQDVTVAKMMENGVDFGDIVEGLAMKNGISTTAMAEQMKALGITYGDTMGVIEAFGRGAVDAIVGDLKRLSDTAGEAGRIVKNVGSLRQQLNSAKYGATFGGGRTGSDVMALHDNKLASMISSGELDKNTLPASVLRQARDGPGRDHAARRLWPWVGEEGPEMVTLPRGAQVHPNGSGPGVNVNDQFQQRRDYAG